MTTHDFDSLTMYADRVVLIDHAVLKDGSAREVLQSEEFLQTFHRKGGIL